MIGKNIKKIRLNNNLTLQKLAEESGLTRSLISQIENGKANPSINTLKKLARTLNVSIGSFFNEDDDHNIVVKYEIEYRGKTKTEDRLWEALFDQSGNLLSKRVIILQQNFNVEY